MRRDPIVLWEARLYRRWLRVLTRGAREDTERGLAQDSENELVMLLQDRLDDVGGSRPRRLWLLTRSFLDALRHARAAATHARTERRGASAP